MNELIAYYLSRSVLWFTAEDGQESCCNMVEEEARQGNELAKKAVEAKRQFLKDYDQNKRAFKKTEQSKIMDIEEV